ncbi:ankyrin repeat-containing protein At5g02620-like [Papaver somniferum]|uniref:ankyrin repeat-containing protein At5g02620-like n=1 Tax=Papaver somniferum TaxID=3469 RepID=UPI000E7002C7|nr:ankyrin repeat-containing protein At5g02620-like [Papaver somniferum]
MDPRLYEAITSGNIYKLEGILATRNDVNEYITTQITATRKNSVLHVAAQFKRKMFIEEICKRCSQPELLIMQQNLNGDTVLHIAARLGLSDIVVALIHHMYANNSRQRITVQELLRMTNKQNDTALHEAVRNHKLLVGRFLIEADPLVEYFPNNAGETPLYLAAEEGLYDFAVQILQCPSSAHNGPDGKKALHVAVAKGYSDITKLLLEKKPSMIYQRDKKGNSALHYAAYFAKPKAAIQLLEADPSIAWAKDNDGKTALHIAASSRLPRNIAYLLKEVTKCCQECWEELDNNGRNFLHIAAESGNVNVIKYILGKSNLAENIINDEDNQGNTPLHLVLRSKCVECLKILSRDKRVNKTAVNRDNLTALDILLRDLDKADMPHREFIQAGYRYLFDGGLLWYGRSQIRIDGEDESFGAITRNKYKIAIECAKELTESQMLVTTLVSAVTYTAGLALPGNYITTGGPSSGLATLNGVPAFKAFAGCNSTALLLSIIVLLIHYFNKLIPHRNAKSVQRRAKLDCSSFDQLNYNSNEQSCTAVAAISWTAGATNRAGRSNFDQLDCSSYKENCTAASGIIWTAGATNRAGLQHLRSAGLQEIRTEQYCSSC